jgi:hypothetical protein
MARAIEVPKPMTNETTPFGIRKKARAIFLGDRIDTSGLEQTDVLSTAPLAFRAGKDGVVTLFRYGVAVLFGGGRGHPRIAAADHQSDRAA